MSMASSPLDQESHQEWLDRMEVILRAALTPLRPSVPDEIINNEFDEKIFILKHYPVQRLGIANKQLLRLIGYPRYARLTCELGNELCLKRLEELQAFEWGD